MIKILKLAKHQPPPQPLQTFERRWLDPYAG